MDEALNRDSGEVRVSQTKGSHRRARLFGVFVGAALFVTSSIAATLPSAASSFTPSMGITRAQTESLFNSIDGKHTVFTSATTVKSIPRVLGGDKRLFTAVEINGNPEVTDVQVVTVVDTTNKSILEQQVSYDSLTCREFASEAAQKFCTGRILNTNSKGLITASESKTFSGLKITVRTYRAKNGSGPPIFSLDFKAV
jgi:hypothetical protein